MRHSTPISTRSWNARTPELGRHLGKTLPAKIVEPEIARNRADQDASCRESRLRLLADSFPGAVAYIDGDGRHVFGNSAYRQWFGAGDGIEGVSMIELFGATAYARLRPFVTAALAGRSVIFETSLPHPELGQKAVRVSYVPQIGDDGTGIGFFALIRQFAESNRAAPDHPRSEVELFYVHRVATMGEMVTSLAHDLNQPLGAITSYVGGLTHMLYSGVEKDDVIPILHKIAEQAKSAADIVRGVREFVDRSAGRHALVDMNQLLRKAVSLTEGRARQIGAHVHLQMAPRLCPVSGEAVQLEQVLINLITNALEAMENTAPGARKLTLRSTSRGIDYVELTVRDTGEGIPADHLGRVFEAFHTTKREGMGMGLSISRAIVETHGGRLWAESESGAGRGACFFVRLPVAKPDEVDNVA